MSCPACGSSNQDEILEDYTYEPVYAPAVTYQAPLVRCRECNEAFAADGHDDIIRKVYADAHKEEVRLILEHLETQGLSKAYVERKLRMPSRTLAKWLEEGPGPGGLMLLRFVRRDPSLLKLFPGTV